MRTSKKAVAAKPQSTFEQIGRIFQQVHESAVHAQKCKKDLINASRNDEKQVRTDVCSILLLILKQMPSITADALKRHYAFLLELCRALRESLNTDALAIDIVSTMLPYHNANERCVRLAVVSMIEVVLKTVDQGNDSDERQDLYQDVAEMLKQRVHDKCPQVRVKAASAVAAFQTGKKDCDVTQQLIALLCTDANADVRKQILDSIAPRKEFLEGYFHGMVRTTRDVVARVRAAAWDALGRFPWRYITAYGNAKGIPLQDLVFQGLGDSNTSVQMSCRAALTNCWLSRDCKGVCEEVLNPIACGFVLQSLEPFDGISAELLAYSVKRNSNTHFPLDLEDINVSGLLLWKADCRASCDKAGEDETQLLLPLDQFSAVLQDTVYAYARPETPPKTVKFRSVEDADNMLRVLLSVFDIYDDNAYLAHTDSTTRGSLLRLMNFLLKVVPDDDPSLFVDVTVRSLKSLTARTPEEGTKTVTAALDSLFRSLKLPQRHGLGFDDVEALGRKSRERQQELVRRRVLLHSGEMTTEQYDELKEEMDRDEKFLLRMQLIVLAFMSHSERGDAIPTFCYHIIQLGRNLDHEKVRVAATKSLCLQCLVNPDSVHTFMPLILADAQENVVNMDVSLPLTAIGVVFDLIMEYGLKFFDVATRQGHTTYNVENELEARLQHEQELAAEDIHKVGSRHLLQILQLYLCVGHEPKHAITAAGFCKLLSCNRIPSDLVPHIIAQLMIHYATTLESRKTDSTAAYMSSYFAMFFRGYAASHPKRQEQTMKGGIAAFRAILTRNTSAASKLLEVLARLTDAYTLTLIRDIDPLAAKRATKETGTDLATDDAAQSRSNRSTVTRSSMQSGRLLRELSRHSLHERVSEELLLEMASNDVAESRAACMSALEKCMYFYNKDPQPFLLFCLSAAMEACRSSYTAVYNRLEEWRSEILMRAVTAVAEGGDTPAAELKARWEELLTARHSSLEALLGAGYGAFSSLPPLLGSSESSTQVKLEPDRKRDRDADFFDVESIVGTRKQVRQ